MYDFSKKLLLAQTNKTYLQFFRYTIVGGLAFVVDIALLYVFTEYFHLYYLLSAGLSFTCGLLVNFIIARKIVFSRTSQHNHFFEFTIVGLISLIGLGLNQTLIWYATERIGLYYMYSKIIAAIVVYSWNFFARKYSLYK